MQGSILLADFLAGLSAEEAAELYGSPAPARFVFRQLLPPLAQQLVLRLLFGGGQPLQESALRQWAAPSASEALAEALKALRRFHVLLPCGEGEAARRPLALSRPFQERLSSHLLGKPPEAGRGPPAPQPAPAPQRWSGRGGAPSAAELQQHAVSSWDALLWSLTAGHVGAERRAQSARVAEVVSDLGLREDGQLTCAGFRFVLDDRQRQLWALALAFLERAKAAKEHLGPLRLLLALGEAKIGECLDFGAQTPRERLLVELLADLGVLSRQDSLGGRWATPAALALFRQDASAALSRSIAGTAGELELPAHLYQCALPERPAEARAQSDEQGIIVESNFKVYAYTSSPLHVCLLGLFCKMVSRLPNLVVGHLSAEPALRAMKQGIRVENIVRYLEAAAHPRALKRLEDGSPVVPNNVRGQLEVWESSRTRTKCSRAVLFEWEAGELETSAFERLRNLAEEQGALLWSRCVPGGAGQAQRQDADVLPMALAVTAEGAPLVRSLLARRAAAVGRPRLRGPNGGIERICL